MKRAVAAFFILSGLASSALAAETTIEAFYGHWVGEGIAETETGQDTERQVRGLEVIVREHPTGFQLCWSTTRVIVGKPDRQTFAMMLFAPSEAPDSWKATFSADGSASEASARAELKEGTLRVFNRATDENGDTQLQIYERSLTRGGMDLHFTRFDSDELVRVVQGRLEAATIQSTGASPSWC